MVEIQSFELLWHCGSFFIFKTLSVVQKGKFAKHDRCWQMHRNILTIVLIVLYFEIMEQDHVKKKHFFFDTQIYFSLCSLV